MATFTPDLLRSTRLCPRLLRSTQCSQYRAFTTSPARRKHGPLPTFLPTSSPELDNLLTTFRATVFLPSHLLKTQQNLIYRTSKHHHLLGEDPVNIELPTSLPPPHPAPEKPETFTLVPLNKFEEPSTKMGFHKLLSLLKTKQDWAVVGGFLEGLKWSGRIVTTGMAEKLIRRASQAGRMSDIIEILRRAERTGLQLGNVYLARVYMFGALQTVIQSGWSAVGAAKAAKQAETGLVFIEDPKHVPGKNAPREMDPRRAPDVFACAMGLIAFDGLKGRETGHVIKVERYARRVLNLWDNRDMEVKEGDWNGANRRLVVWGMVESGLEWSIRLLGDGNETGQRLREVLERDVKPLVEKCNRILDEHTTDTPRLGPVTYEELKRAGV